MGTFPDYPVNDHMQVAYNLPSASRSQVALHVTGLPRAGAARPPPRFKLVLQKREWICCVLESVWESSRRSR